jgi:hypothetical protein
MNNYDYWKFGYGDDDEEEKIRKMIKWYGDDYYMVCDCCKEINNNLRPGDDCHECESGVIVESIKY